MYKRILVPLDGSTLAESVLPTAYFWAEKFDAILVFFHVLEAGASKSIHGEHHLSAFEEAKAYLEQVTARRPHKHIRIEMHVHETKQPDVPQSIIAHAGELKTDLIILCAHGSGGLRDMFIGSIAQQVIQRGTIPVYFLRPLPETNRRAPRLDKIVLPLDGTDKHVSTLPTAAEIGKISGALLHLVTVIPTTSTLPANDAQTGLLLPVTMTAMLDLAQRGAHEYLVEVVKGLTKQGIKATGEVRRGDIPSEIIKAGEDADLLIMSTHARVNWDAFWEESVTPRVMARAKVPLLIVRTPRS